MPEQYKTEQEEIDLSRYEKTLFVNDAIAQIYQFDPEQEEMAFTDTLTDSFRKDIDNFWTSHETIEQLSNALMAKKLSLKKAPLVLAAADKQKLYSFYSNSLQEEISLRKIDSVPFNPETGELVETFEIRQTSPIEFPPNNRWTNWCLDNFSTKTNTDFVFSMNSPERSEKDFDSAAGLVKNFVKIKSNYNYYKLDYENLIGDSLKLGETSLPNLYTYMSVVQHNNNMKDAELQEKNTPTDKQLLVFENHLTFNGIMEGLDVKNLFYKEPSWYQAEGTESKFELANNTIGNYFSLWTKTADVLMFNTIDEVSSPYENIIFSASDFKIVDNPNSAASSFPMNVEVEIETEKNNFVMNALGQTKQDKFLQAFVAKSQNKVASTPFVLSVGDSTEIALDYEQWSMQEFISKALDGELVNEEEPANTIFIGNHKENYDFSAPQNSFFVTLMSLAMKSKLDNFIKTTFRGYENLLNGEECYSETLVYEVEKWYASSDGNLISKLQSFYLPNDSTQTIKFFDTQVKYNKSYVYRIYAYKAVFGTSYSYSIDEENIVDVGQGRIASFTVTSSPNIKIIRTPYYNVNEGVQGTYGNEFVGPGRHRTTVVLDEAPLPPEIEIVPLIKEPSKIIINMKDTIGSMKQKPRPIEEDDIGLYQALLEKQYKEKFDIHPQDLYFITEFNVLNESILFKSDDPSLYMQMFHTIEKPKTYSDFQNSIKQLLNGPNNSAKINLNFNQKNYFTFRAIDQHGKFSNPTDVYEVEIKEEDGVSFPIIKLINLEEEAKKEENLERQKNNKISLTGKRFLHIKPCYQQWMMKEKYVEEEFPSAFDIPDFSIGEADQSVFQKDRKFKIRLTSKKTGRKVDINVKFKQRQEKIY